MLSALSSKACISDALGVHLGLWKWQLAHLERQHQRYVQVLSNKWPPYTCFFSETAGIGSQQPPCDPELNEVGIENGWMDG